MTRLLIAITLIVTLIAAHPVTVKASTPLVDPIWGTLTDVQFDREGGENGIYTATLTRSWYVTSIALEFTEEMTPSNDLEDGIVDVYQETYNDDDGTIAQHNRYYRFWTIDAMPDRIVTVIVGINGQTGDTGYDTFYADHGAYCTVIAVIDDVNDTTNNGAIYTRLICTLTQDTATNLHNTYDSVLFVTMAYTINAPIIINN